jgi:hypothetical protein
MGFKKSHFYKTVSHIVIQGNTVLGLLDHALVPAQYCNAQLVKLKCSKYGTNNINTQQLTINVLFHTVRFLREQM